MKGLEAELVVIVLISTSILLKKKHEISFLLTEINSVHRLTITNRATAFACFGIMSMAGSTTILMYRSKRRQSG